METGDQRQALGDLPLGKRPGTHCIEGWVSPAPVWTVAENLLSGIQPPERQACSESLCRLHGPIYRLCNQCIALSAALLHYGIHHALGYTLQRFTALSMAYDP
jgi:hypothetical protein